MKRIFYEGASKALRRMAEFINRKPELGETHEDAYYGDHGKDAYDHSQLTSGTPHHVTADDIGLGSVLARLEAIMYVLGMMQNWITHRGEQITDHSGNNIVFHGVGKEEERKYLLYH